MERTEEQTSLPGVATEKLRRMETALMQLRSMEALVDKMRRPDDPPRYGSLGRQFAIEVLEAVLGGEPRVDVMVDSIDVHLDFQRKGEQNG